MGNVPQSAESRHAAVTEVSTLFDRIDSDGDGEVTKQEWAQAFRMLDSNGNRVVSRKEWCIQRGSTHVFDACRKKVDAHMTSEEWMQAFKAMADGSGSITPQKWLARRPVRLGLSPIGMGLQHWGVGVGDSFYELLAWGRGATEMVAVGPKGLVECGAFARQQGLRKQWIEKARLETKAGRRPAQAWSEDLDEPMARSREDWADFEMVGGTSRTDDEITAWIRQWIKEHPTYKAMDAFGSECNDQTFAADLIAWLMGSRYTKATDNQKGRTLVYGGLVLLAGAGAAYLSSRSRAAGSCDQAVAAVDTLASSVAMAATTSSGIAPLMSSVDSMASST